MNSRLNTKSATTTMTGMVARIRLTTYVNMRLRCRQSYAVLPTPQKNGIGPFTTPLTFLRHAW